MKTLVVTNIGKVDVYFSDGSSLKPGDTQEVDSDVLVYTKDGSCELQIRDENDTRCE